jgi:hypothetical protein
MLGILKSPNDPVVDFSPYLHTVQVGRALNIAIQLIRYGLDPSTKNKDGISSLDMLNDRTGNIYGFGKGFFPDTIRNFITDLGIEGHIEDATKKHPGIDTLLSLERDFYLKIQQLPSMLKQLGEFKTQCENKSIIEKIEHEQSIIRQFLALYEKTIASNEARTISDLKEAINEAGEIHNRVTAYLKPNEATNKLEISLLKVKKELLQLLVDRARLIQQTLQQGKNLSQVQGQQLMSYQQNIRELVSALSKIEVVPIETKEQISSMVATIKNLQEKTETLLCKSKEYLDGLHPTTAAATVVVTATTTTTTTTATTAAITQAIPPIRTGFDAAAASASELEAFGRFLNLVKTGNETAIVAQLQKYPRFATMVLQRSSLGRINAIMVAASNMQVHTCLFLIRLGASITTSITSDDATPSGINFMSSALKEANTNDLVIAGMLELLKQEEILYKLITQFQEKAKICEAILVLETVAEVHKNSLIKYCEKIARLVEKYQHDIFTITRESSETKSLLEEGNEMLNNIESLLKIIREEQQKLVASGITEICDKLNTLTFSAQPVVSNKQELSPESGEKEQSSVNVAHRNKPN